MIVPRNTYKGIFFITAIVVFVFFYASIQGFGDDPNTQTQKKNSGGSSTGGTLYSNKKNSYQSSEEEEDEQDLSCNFGVSDTRHLTKQNELMVGYSNKSSRHYDRVMDIGSKKLAYAFYITQEVYFCAASITAHRLRQWTDVDIVFVFVDSFHPSESVLSKIKKIPNVIIRTFPNLHANHDHGSFWIDSLNKFHVFRLIEYDRVIYLDADLYVLRNLDHLFALPDCTLAVPRAYWLNPQPFLTDILMVLVPSQETFDLVWQTSQNHRGWDMDVINDLFIRRNDFLFLPGIYGLLNFEFSTQDTHHFGPNYEDTYHNRAYLYHWSGFKPWNVHKGSHEVSGKGSLYEKTWQVWADGKEQYC